MGGRSDYEERRKRRIERYKELSLKAQERSSQYSNSNANRILQIVPGQPILVGHHSEKRHRKLIKKAQDDIRKSIEEDNKSNFYKERAENAENSKVIYSDDPQAIIKLKEKLEAPMVQARYQYAIDVMLTRLRMIDADLTEKNERPLIRNLCSRIKTAESIVKKLERKEREVTFETAVQYF